MSSPGASDGGYGAAASEPQQHQPHQQQQHRNPPRPRPPGPLPPRPDCVATLLTTDDFLPGVRTLLYSVKENLSPPSSSPSEEYEPEFVVLATPAVSQQTRSALHPTFCTRIIDVDPIPFPSAAAAAKAGASSGSSKGSSHVTAWDEHCGLTKLNVFGLQQYGTVLYVDADCLVLRDVRHLLRLGREHSDDIDNTEAEAEEAGGGEEAAGGLIAAAPDIFPPDKFNAGVMVLQPSLSVFADMMERASRSTQNGGLESYDGGDTGFLNAYYPNWYSDFPPRARLSFGYNAQRFMHRCTYGKRPEYWDLGIGKDNLHVVHYSSTPKPWETMQTMQAEEATKDGSASASSSGKKEEGGGGSGAAASAAGVGDHLTARDAKALSEAGRTSEPSELDVLWRQWYNHSRAYAEKFRREEEQRKAKSKKRRTAGTEKLPSPRRQQQQQKQQQQHPSSSSPQDVHRLVTRRFKELRNSGMSARDAMAKARADCGADRADAVGGDAGTQVMRMFGMG